MAARMVIVSTRVVVPAVVPARIVVPACVPVPVAMPARTMPAHAVESWAAPMCSVKSRADEAPGRVKAPRVKTPASPRHGVGRNQQSADEAGNGGGDECPPEHANPHIFATTAM